MIAKIDHSIVKTAHVQEQDALAERAGADPTASGATRVAGTANFKAKYAPEFPIVPIAAAELGRIVSRGQLAALGLVAAGPTTNTALTMLLWPTAVTSRISAVRISLGA